MFDKKHISVDGPRGYTWVEWFEIVDLLGQIDYDCQFDCDGTCKETRRSAERRGCEVPNSHHGCCNGCARNRGYGIVMPPEAVAEVEAGFDKEFGWWRPGGCTLSPEYKSVICWDHNCAKGNPEIWKDIYRLVGGTCFLTVEEVRTILAANGMLREQQLVTIS